MIRMSFLADETGDRSKSIKCWVTFQFIDLVLSTWRSIGSLESPPSLFPLGFLCHFGWSRWRPKKKTNKQNKTKKINMADFGNRAAWKLELLSILFSLVFYLEEAAAVCFFLIDKLQWRGMDFCPRCQHLSAGCCWFHYNSIRWWIIFYVRGDDIRFCFLVRC